MIPALAPDTIPNFWDWSLSAYKTKGVANTLLQLQDDHGLNINLLLWCVWAGKFYCELEDAAVLRITSDTAQWHEKITKPLRQTRQDIKILTIGIPPPEQDSLRRRIKTLELESERLEQNYLAALTRQYSGTHRHARGTNAWNYNLTLYRQNTSGLELDAGLSVNAPADRIKILYLRILKLIFPTEVVYL